MGCCGDYVVGCDGGCVVVVVMLWIAVVGWLLFYSFPLQYVYLSCQLSGGSLVCANIVVVWVVGRLVVVWVVGRLVVH